LQSIGYGSFKSDIVNAIINSMAKGYRWGGGDPEKYSGSLCLWLIWSPHCGKPQLMHLMSGVHLRTKTGCHDRPGHGSRGGVPSCIITVMSPVGLKFQYSGVTSGTSWVMMVSLINRIFGMGHLTGPPTSYRKAPSIHDADQCECVSAAWDASAQG